MMGNNKEIGKTTGASPEASQSHPLEQYSVQPPSGEHDKSPYYKPAAPSISLPKGGGALKGIDETFSVNAVNGTAGVEIGLPFTPGRGGFTPSLALSYSSGSGNSEFGLGWSLSLPSIQRKTGRRIPEYDDANDSDVFLLAGAEDLVPMLDSNGLPMAQVVGTTLRVTRYRPRIEGLFARIEQLCDLTTLETWWRVTTTDNVTTYYGLTDNGRISDPARPGRIFKWLPQLACDDKGNVQQYTYIAENLQNVTGLHERNRLNGKAPITNRYLKRVGYCNLQPWFNDSNFYRPQLPNQNPAIPDITYLMELVFDYGDHAAGTYFSSGTAGWPCRPDAFSDFNAGFEIRTYRRCRRVMMFHRFTELNNGKDTLVRSLEFSCTNDHLAPGEHAEADLVSEVRQYGYQAIPGAGEGIYYSRALPAMSFSHQPLAWDTTLVDVSPEDAENAPQGLTGNYQWIDLWGEGLPGILTEQASGWFYKQNLGEGRFSPAARVSPKPSLRGLGTSLQWADLDADGRRQLVSRDRSLPGYFELNDGQEWEPFRSFDHNANVDWNSPYTRILDLDGDGRPDLLVTEDRVWTWYHNDGTEGFTEGGQALTFHDEEQGPRLLLNDRIQRIFLADMTGDGMTDLVRITNGEVCYWPNKGFGRFGARIVMSNAPTFDHADDFNPLYLTLADISGTGATDLLYLGNNRLTAWINLAGNAWGEAHAIAPLPAMDPYSKIAVLDFLGNGTGCIVWSSPLPRYAGAPIRYIDLMGGVKPYLMLGYRNGMGKEVRVSYKSSSTYYLADQSAGAGWATRLPFPVQCVDRITTLDEVSETTYSQRYSYHHGYYDHEEREFRGFGRVDTTDTEQAAYFTRAGLPAENDLDQHPVLTRTWFHTGAWMRERTLLEQYGDEYYRFEGWDDLLTAGGFPEGLSAQELREAHRALKGQTIRQEVYALDGTAKSGMPYSVAVSAHRVVLVQAQAANRHAVFFSYGEQSLTYSCERNPADPRVAQQATLAIDEYGNVLEQMSVVYPRRTANKPPDIPSIVWTAQNTAPVVTLSVATFTADATGGSNHYRLRLPATARQFEVTGVVVPASGLLSVAQLQLAATNAVEIDYLTTPPGTGLTKRLLSSSRTLYLKNDTTGPLPLRALESLGIPYQSYQLAFTGRFTDASNPFGSRLTALRLLEGGYVDLDGDNTFWIPSGTASYVTPATRFYNPTSFTDPFGNTTSVVYWSSVNDYWLVPRSVTDAVGNVSTVLAYDWRILQPLEMKDPNDNRSQILYDTLGMPVAMAAMGKGSEGDSLTGITAEDYTNQALFWQDPQAHAARLLKGASWRCVYDLDRRPAAVAMIARERHEVDLPVSPVLIRITYTDGFGRIAMHKVQATDDPATGAARWIGSGKTVCNNKGKEVLRYEPYFSTTHLYDPALQAAHNGVSPRLYYDALGRLWRTLMPDGTFSYVSWDSWSQRSYDANDTVLLSSWYQYRQPGGALAGIAEEVDAATKAAAHAGTPTVVHMDLLGRGFYTIQTDGINLPIESYEQLDITGNRMAVVDGRGLTPLTYRYNLVGAPIKQHSVDGGDTYALLDVAGQPLYSWDADDKLFHFVYDNLRRPLEQWGDGRLLNRTEYGEGEPNDKAFNLRGQVVAAYDGAGKQYVEEYDFKGIPKRSYMRLLADAKTVNAHWNVLSDADLVAGELFFNEVALDALGRPRSADTGRMLGTGTPTTEHNITLNTYGKDGALKTVVVGADSYINDIRHNAKGQREAIWYGNGTKTSYRYDALNQRLRRLWTTRSSDNAMLQDLNYFYDPVGNITTIRDDAQETVWFANSVISPKHDYTYDALYRLIKAQGRESIQAATFGAGADNTQDAHAKRPASVPPWGAGVDALQHYTQYYGYDAVGNILQLQHSAGAGSYTRNYSYDPTSNRLLSTSVSGQTYNYSHDVRGNMIQMPHLAAMDYDLLNQMHHVTAGGSQAYYQYSGGQRVRKFLDKGSVTEERVYFGGYEVYRKWTGSTLDVERTTLHVTDDTGRIAMIEKRTAGSDGSLALLKRFIYSNHLQSATLELDESGVIISYEEYHPYGTTAYQKTNSVIVAVAKRYRFTGKERDEETGLNYHGARYYAPWLGRWCAVDPLENDYPDLSAYNYGLNNPVVYNDPNGMYAHASDQRIQTYSQAEATHTTNIELGAVKQVSSGSIRYEDAILTPSYDNNDKLVGYEVYSMSVHTEMPLLEIGASAVADFKERYGNGLWAGAILAETGGDANIKKAGAEWSVGHYREALNAIGKANSEAWSDPVYRANFILSLANVGLGFVSRPVSGGSRAVPTPNRNNGPGVNSGESTTRSLATPPKSGPRGQLHTETPIRAAVLSERVNVSSTRFSMLRKVSGDIQSVVSSGTVPESTLRSYVPSAAPNEFIPSNRIAAGYKYTYTTANGQRVQIKWHSPDSGAPVGGNSNTVWTAQISIGNKLLGVDGNLYRKPTNLTHIPVLMGR